jgi:hypothetical protein
MAAIKSRVRAYNESPGTIFLCVQHIAHSAPTGHHLFNDRPAFPCEQSRLTMTPYTIHPTGYGASLQWAISNPLGRTARRSGYLDLRSLRWRLAVDDDRDPLLSLRPIGESQKRELGSKDARSKAASQYL